MITVVSTSSAGCPGSLRSSCVGGEFLILSQWVKIYKIVERNHEEKKEWEPAMPAGQKEYEQLKDGIMSWRPWTRGCVGCGFMSQLFQMQWCWARTFSNIRISARGYCKWWKILGMWCGEQLVCVDQVWISQSVFEVGKLVLEDLLIRWGMHLPKNDEPSLAGKGYSVETRFCVPNRLEPAGKYIYAQ